MRQENSSAAFCEMNSLTSATSQTGGNNFGLLNGRAVRLSNQGVAARYAKKLLVDLGVSAVGEGPTPDVHPVVAWVESGLMWLTGHADQAPLICPAPVASCAEGVLKALEALPGGDALAGMNVAQVLSGRAVLLNLSRNGPISANGHCRLLEAVDGWIAVNLARKADWELVPAWLQDDRTQFDWQAIITCVADSKVEELIEQAGLLGLPVAEVAKPQPRPWLRVGQTGPKSSRSLSDHRPLVVDLSALWAGPLASHLLLRLGARVIKVEDWQRPDGAREGNVDLYNLLNAGKESLAVDLRSDAGISALKSLIAKADIIIEGSRPRALRQLGIDAAALVVQKPGLTWLSITGYGRGPEEQNRVAFGDDAAVAGGLVWLMHQSCGERVFCGNAIADPLTGLHAALAAWAGWLSGEATLLDVALRNVVAHICSFEMPTTVDALTHRISDWQAVLDEAGVQASRPTAEVPNATAAQLGAHNALLSSEFNLAC